MTQQPQPGRCQRGASPRRRQPFFDIAPCFSLVEHASHLMKGNPGSHQHIGDLGNRTGRTVGKPAASHGSPVLELVKGRVIDGRFRLQVEYDHRHTGALDKRQHGVRKGIGGDVQKQDVDVLSTALMARLEGACGRIDQAQIDQLDARPREPRRNLLHIPFQHGLEPRKLAPIGIQTDTAESYP